MSEKKYPLIPSDTRDILVATHMKLKESMFENKFGRNLRLKKVFSNKIQNFSLAERVGKHVENWFADILNKWQLYLSLFVFFVSFLFSFLFVIFGFYINSIEAMIFLGRKFWKSSKISELKESEEQLIFREMLNS